MYCSTNLAGLAQGVFKLLMRYHGPAGLTNIVDPVARGGGASRARSPLRASDPWEQLSVWVERLLTDMPWLVQYKRRLSGLGTSLKPPKGTSVAGQVAIELRDWVRREEWGPVANGLLDPILSRLWSGANARARKRARSPSSRAIRLPTRVISVGNLEEEAPVRPHWLRSCYDRRGRWGEVPGCSLAVIDRSGRSPAG